MSIKNFKKSSLYIEIIFDLVYNSLSLNKKVGEQENYAKTPAPEEKLTVRNSIYR